MKSFFDLDHHAAILRWALAREPRHGAKAKLAAAIRCQASYLSLVLQKKANLSLEQAEEACRYLGFGTDETEYMLLLVQLDRAGTKSLKARFREKIEALRARRLLVVERLGRAEELSPEKQATYYSSWIFAAVHIALTIPDLRTSSAISSYLGVPLLQVVKALDFLESAGLATQQGGQFFSTKNLVRLSKESNNIVKHHTNWRLRAIDSLESEKAHELHYSAVFSASREDVIQLKDQMLEHLKVYLKGVQASKEEDLFILCLDLFDLKRD